METTMTLTAFLVRLFHRPERSESGMTTAELLGNAALGVLALVVIWGLLQALGVDIVNWIRGQLL
jgi:hypothetical protein